MNCGLVVMTPKKNNFRTLGNVKSTLIICTDYDGVGPEKEKLPGFWARGEWFLHHYNVSAHLSSLVYQFLTKYNVVLL